MFDTGIPGERDEEEGTPRSRMVHDENAVGPPVLISVLEQTLPRDGYSSLPLCREISQEA